MLTKERPLDQAVFDEERHVPRIIRLRLEDLRMEGIARSFSAADKMLIEWCARFPGQLCCEYEVIYVDANIVHGRYLFRSNAGGRPCLERFLHKELVASETVEADFPLHVDAGVMDEPEESDCMPQMTRTRIRLPAYSVAVSEK
jgi:hypothetical protein